MSGSGLCDAVPGEIADGDALESLAEFGRTDLHLGVDEHEQADDHHPQTAVAANEHQEPDSGQQPRQDGAGSPCLACSPVAAPVLRPADRLDDTATVERCSRQQVERSEDRVDDREPHHDGGDRTVELSRTGRPPDAGEHDGEPEARKRPGGSDPALGACRRRLALQPCDATERPQLDRLGLDVVAAGGQRVGELVHEDRDEEADDSDRGGGPADGARQAGTEEHRDDGDAPVHVDPNAEPRAQP